MVLKRCVLLVVLGLMIVAPLLGAAGHPGHEPGDPSGFVETNDWTGFMACGVGSPFLISTGFCAFDGNDHHTQTFAVDEDLKTIVVAMEWDSVALGSESLQIFLNGGPEGHGSGPSAIEFRLDEGEDFDPITQPQDLSFLVLPPFELSMIYQQVFTVYYHEFYGEHAPAGYSALPDH